MTEAEILASIVKRIEAVRDEKKLLSGSERDLFAEAKDKHIDGKALRRVLQRRAMDDADREAFDDLVDQYEQALAGKAVAAAALKAGATVREAAKAGGVSVSTAQRTKNRVSERTAAYDAAAPEAASGKGDPAAADPIPPSSAAAAPVVRPLPLADVGAFPPAALDTPDAEYLADAARNYGEAIGAIRDTLVASGAARLHPAEIDITIPDVLRRA